MCSIIYFPSSYQEGKKYSLLKFPKSIHGRCVAGVTWRSSVDYSATGTVQEQSINISKCVKLTKTRWYQAKWWLGFMTISAIAASLLPRKDEKSIFPKIDLWTAGTRSNIDLGSKIGDQSRILSELNMLTLLRSAPPISLETPRGVVSPLFWRSWQNVEHGRGLIRALEGGQASDSAILTCFSRISWKRRRAAPPNFAYLRTI